MKLAERPMWSAGWAALSVLLVLFAAGTGQVLLAVVSAVACVAWGRSWGLATALPLHDEAMRLAREAVRQRDEARTRKCVHDLAREFLEGDDG